MALSRPRTIRSQLIAGLILFEIALVAVFAAFVIHHHDAEVRMRAVRRLEYQCALLTVQMEDALAGGRYASLQRMVSTMARAQSIRSVQITGTDGRTLYSSDPTMNGKLNLAPLEKKYLHPRGGLVVFDASGGEREAVAPVRIQGELKALVWVYPNETPDRSELYSLLRLTLGFAIVGAIGCVLLAVFLARSITRPLKRLLEATRKLIRNPEDTTVLPLAVAASSEAADLTTAFNLMVSSIEEQRAGLTDTLALLDSMLANAPIGLAFFDSKCRFVRINQFLADENQISMSRQLGHNLTEVFPGAVGYAMQDAIQSVFDTSIPARDMEITESVPEHARSWVIHAYPVRTATHTVRWVGAIILETTERKRSEQALRRSEKLAAVGQLSSSIAHEINNPLESVTNLLYLLGTGEELDSRSANYVHLAQNELARVSEIVQQTLRFYKQTTQPVVTQVSEIFDSVLTLHQGRVYNLQVEVVRKYRPGVELLCLDGELRQVFNNFISNALDSMMMTGGRLTLEVRHSRSWRDSSTGGVRIFVADTGCGMNELTRRRIFEPFFTTKEATGTGLGLWVSAEIMQKHGATVRVRSRVAGRGRASGTVFMVFFPDRELPGAVRSMASEGAGKKERRTSLVAG